MLGPGWRILDVDIGAAIAETKTNGRRLEAIKGVSRPRMYLALVCHYMILAQVNAGTGAFLSDSRYQDR